MELLGKGRPVQNLPSSAGVYLRIAYILCQWMYKIMGHVRNLETRALGVQPNLGFFCEWGRVESFPSHRCYTFFGWLLSVTNSSLSLCGFF